MVAKSSKCIESTEVCAYNETTEDTVLSLVSSSTVEKNTTPPLRKVCSAVCYERLGKITVCAQETLVEVPDSLLEESPTVVPTKSECMLQSAKEKVAIASTKTKNVLNMVKERYELTATEARYMLATTRAKCALAATGTKYVLNASRSKRTSDEERVTEELAEKETIIAEEYDIIREPRYYNKIREANLCHAKVNMWVISIISVITFLGYPLLCYPSQNQKYVSYVLLALNISVGVMALIFHTTIYCTTPQHSSRGRK